MNLEKHLDGLIDWLLLTKSKEEVLEIVSTPESIAQAMQDYNTDYERFLHKVLELPYGRKERLEKALCVNVYYGIHSRAINQQRAKSLELALEKPIY